MTDVMENVSAAANVVLTTKRGDYEEFIGKLNKLASSCVGSNDIGKISEEIDAIMSYYSEELDFIDTQI